MTDNQQLANADTNTSSSQPTKPAPAKKGGFLSIFTFLLVVILFVVLAGGGWIGYEHHQALRGKLAKLEGQLINVQQADSQSKEALENLAKNIKKQLLNNEQRIATLASSERQDWLLAEAEYLLRLANQRLNLEKDWQGALAMLQAADQVLFETKNPIVDSIRLQIAKEIQALRAVPAVDVIGAVSRLQAVAADIKNLPWTPVELAEEVAVVETVEEAQPLSGFAAFYAKTVDALTSIIRYTKRDEPLKAPLSPQQHYYLQQNLALMLEQAQVALARQNPELYKGSLERAEQWLQEFVLLENPQVKAVQTSLQELKTWNVNPELPAINESLVKLMDLIARQNRGVAATGQE